MPKHKLDYELDFTNKKSKKNKENTTEEFEELDNPVMDIFGVSDSVTVRDNHIYFYCSVNKKNIVKLITSIKDITRKLKIVELDYGVSDLKIYLHINSYGGSVFAALSAIDTIIGNKIPIISIVEGGAASAATLISVVCSERKITPNSYMLVHQLSSTFWGTYSNFEDEKQNLDLMMKNIKNIYKEYTKIPMKKLNEILKHDLFWDANTCLEYGMIDEII